MGYTTTFRGRFELDRPLSRDQRTYLEEFSRTRRMKRKPKLAETLPDPIRAAVGLQIGIQGAYFVGGSGPWGMDPDPSLLDDRVPPAGQPGLFCQWIPDPSGSAIQWDGGEKFYGYVAWLEYLLTHFLVPWGYSVVAGAVRWQGDEYDDCGILEVTGTRVAKRVQAAPWPEPLGEQLGLHRGCPVIGRLVGPLDRVLSEDIYKVFLYSFPKHYAGSKADVIDLDPLRERLTVLRAHMARTLLAPALASVARRAQLGGHLVLAACLRGFAERTAHLDGAGADLTRCANLLRGVEPVERHPADAAIGELLRELRAWEGPGSWDTAQAHAAPAPDEADEPDAHYQPAFEEDDRDCLAYDRFQALPPDVRCATFSIVGLRATEEALELAAADPLRFRSTGLPPEGASSEYWCAYAETLVELLDELCNASIEAAVAATQFMDAGDVREAVAEFMLRIIATHDTPPDVDRRRGVREPPAPRAVWDGCMEALMDEGTPA